MSPVSPHPQTEEAQISQLLTMWQSPKHFSGLPLDSLQLVKLSLTW